MDEKMDINEQTKLEKIAQFFMKKRKSKKLWVCLIGFAIVVIFLGLLGAGAFEKGEEKTITSSTLTDAVNIAELSTAQFTYNGIATVYKDEEKEKVKCYIRYNAKVKAGIDMENIDFEINHEQKTVRPILPPIEVTSNPVEEKSLSFIPENVSIELKDALIACKEDAEREAMESQQLLSVAESNLKSVIEALLYPLLEKEDYSIVWE